jgi:hypothetical protein
LMWIKSWQFAVSGLQLKDANWQLQTNFSEGSL